MLSLKNFIIDVLKGLKYVSEGFIIGYTEKYLSNLLYGGVFSGNNSRFFYLFIQMTIPSFLTFSHLKL